MALPDNPASLPRIQTQEFEGPLDLLLDEVRRQNVEIETIALAPVVSRFLAYVGTAAARNLNLDIDWLHMAATLIHWKSQSLLPSEPGIGAERDPIRDSLVQQLLAHRRQLGEELGRRRTREGERISRFAGDAVAECVESPESPLLCVWDMIQEARRLAAWTEKHRGEVRLRQELGVDRDEVTVAEMSEYLRKRLAGGEGAKLDGGKLLREEEHPSRRACLFLGMLEMAREQELQLEQSEAFGPLWLSAP